MVESVDVFDRVYEKPGAIWTHEEPPEFLKEVIKSGVVTRGRAIDIGCGEGMYSIWLQRRGFEVTGVDFSTRAIEYAKENANRQDVHPTFLCMDALKLSGLRNKFDFAFELGLLHHLNPNELRIYSQQVPAIMKKGSVYLTASFDVSSPFYGAPGQRVRETPFGTTLYYRSAGEVRKLFEPSFKVLRMESIELIGKSPAKDKDNYHPSNLFLMRKK